MGRITTMSTIIFKDSKHKEWAGEILGFKFPGQELKLQSNEEMDFFVMLLDSKSLTEQCNPTTKNRGK